MESLHPRAEHLLETLREHPDKFSRHYLDKLHGEHRAMSNSPVATPEERGLHRDLARAVEMRFRELELLDLLINQTTELISS